MERISKTRKNKESRLKQKQPKVDEIKNCPYCGNKMQYLHLPNGKLIYACRDYPQCTCYASTKGRVTGGKAVYYGIPADAALQERRKEVHHYFSYMEEHMGTNEAYWWLSARLAIQKRYTHFAFFRKYECDKALDEILRYLNANHITFTSYKEK